MNDNVYVWIEDATAPARAEWLATEAEAAQNSAQSNGETTSLPIIQPPHYRTTYITATPPQSFDLLLTQLRAQWQSTRQSGGPGKANIPTIGGPQLVIEGNIFAIGTDWIVRAGNVIQVLGGNVKGMVLEVGVHYYPHYTFTYCPLRRNIFPIIPCPNQLETAPLSFFLIFLPLYFHGSQTRKLWQ